MFRANLNPACPAARRPALCPRYSGIHLRWHREENYPIIIHGVGEGAPRQTVWMGQRVSDGQRR